jgi:hypothetical protein
VLIAVDTPVTPLVHRLMQNPFGIFTLVMIIVTLLCFGMATLLELRERARAKRQTMMASEEEL